MLKWLILIVGLIIFCGQTARAENAESDSTKSIPSPRGAMLRSLVFPGWGQFYNSRKVKGSVMAAAELGSVVAFFVRRDQIQRETLPGVSAPRNVFLFSTIFLMLYSMADAYVDAHLDTVDWEGPDLTTQADSRHRMETLMQVKFSVHF